MNIFGLFVSREDWKASYLDLLNKGGKSLADANLQLVAVKNELSAVQKSNSTMQIQLDAFDRGLQPLPETEAKLRDYWYSRHAPSTVTYAGYNQVVKQKDGKFDTRQYTFDVRSWVSPNAVFESILSSKRLMLSQIIIDNPKMLLFEQYDLCALKIKQFVDSIRNYEFDITEYGVDEEWEWPLATYYIGKDDCDGWANLILCLFVSAKLPHYRMRGCAGNTFSGFGHDTVYWLARDNKWHHLNSTSKNTESDVLDCPLRNSLDGNSIKDVWFSYNYEDAWSSFESDMALSSLPKGFKIVPKD